SRGLGDVYKRQIIEYGLGYPVEYYTTEKAVDGIVATTGCTVGKGSLHLTHCGMKEGRLWFMFVKDGGDYAGKCVYITVDKNELKTWLEQEALATNKETVRRDFMALPANNNTVFPKTMTPEGPPVEDLNYEYLISDAGKARWGNLYGGYARLDASGDEFSVITISNIWAMDNPKAGDVFAVSQMHDHICPGMTAGKFLAAYMYKNLPLGQDEEYHIVSCPQYCKDDYFAWMVHTTPGTKTLTSTTLSSADQQKLNAVGAGNVAGVFIRWNTNTKTGNALVLLFDFGAVATDAGVSTNDFKDYSTYKWWVSRLKCAVAMMQYLDTPERYVSAYGSTYNIDETTFKKLKEAGNNPYVVLGIITP
ncbi:MAG: FmdE family protein, partial [Planctomycetota bacterium]|nr:FmdE family protein [Planctomycetota bacterium]